MTPDYCQLLARYNRWMNEKIYDVTAKLSDAERKRDRCARDPALVGSRAFIQPPDTSPRAGDDAPDAGGARSRCYGPFCDAAEIAFAKSLMSVPASARTIPASPATTRMTPTASRRVLA